MDREEWKKEGRIRADTLYRAVVHMAMIPDYAIEAALSQFEGRCGNDPVMGRKNQQLLKALKCYYAKTTRFGGE